MAKYKLVPLAAKSYEMLAYLDTMTPVIVRRKDGTKEVTTVAKLDKK